MKIHFHISPAWLLLAVISAVPGMAYSGQAEALAEQVWLDDSGNEEIIISNNESAGNLPVTPSETPPAQVTTKGWQLASPPYQPEVWSAARDTALDPALIHAVIAVESGYNARAVSPKGAYGLMQVLPATARGLSPVPVRQWSASQQVRLGASYLKQMLVMFEGDITLALAAYNAGPQAVKAHHGSIPPFSETRQYVPRVMAYYHAFKQHLVEPH